MACTSRLWSVKIDTSINPFLERINRENNLRGFIKRKKLSLFLLGYSTFVAPWWWELLPKARRGLACWGNTALVCWPFLPPASLSPAQACERARAGGGWSWAQRELRSPCSSPKSWDLAPSYVNDGRESVRESRVPPPSLPNTLPQWLVQKVVLRFI